MPTRKPIQLWMLIFLILLLGCGDGTTAIAEADVLPLTQTWQVIYSVEVWVEPGDTLLCTGEMEVTNDLGFNVCWSTMMILAERHDETEGTRIGYVTAKNVTPAMHHDVQSKIGMITVDQSGTIFVIFLATAFPSTYSEPGDYLTLHLEPRRGGLKVLLIPGGTELYE